MSDAEEIITLARRAVETYIGEDRLLDVPSELSAGLRRRAACFVSIKTARVTRASFPLRRLNFRACFIPLMCFPNQSQLSLKNSIPKLTA